jgi:asparagine synthase (glutamine-hydrolysing)
MCGIWCYCGSGARTLSKEEIANCVSNIEARGPEETVYSLSANWGFGFTRLAINGLKPGCGSQPFSYGPFTWMCNGEIYNHKALEEQHRLGDSIVENGSDCEVIGHLYPVLDKDLIAWARALDGVFAIALYDHETSTLVLARDPYGVRPLYYGFIGDTLYAASEIKGLPVATTGVKAFPPGHVATFTPAEGLIFQKYHAIPWLKNPMYGENIRHDAVAYSLKGALEAAIHKRLMTERPVAALLSGGLDSSLIAALVQRELKRLGKPPLETYSIGFAGSSDLKYARLVADHIGSVHHEIVSTPEEFFAAIPHVIAAIESPDITSVRASVGNWLVAKYIKENSPSGAKVVFNGDGSDEVFGSYLYFYSAPTDEAYEAEVDRLLTDIHHFDVLRSDRSISSHGLEPRTPFLDKQFVAVARSIATKYLRPSASQPEKWLLRQGFAATSLLPSEVLWRRKEAFSDGVSSQEKPWYQEIQERISGQGLEMPSEEEMKQLYPALTPLTLEAYYYRRIYDGFYPNALTVPYFWMPRWSGAATDPSARTLAVYRDKN